ncbi:MAG: hypothetical protein OEW87_13555, partial [Flavobacteriaceae bacterium]|nr:hypothetical protein [Flavobacteriaceae bacterium]
METKTDLMEINSIITGIYPCIIGSNIKDKEYKVDFIAGGRFEEVVFENVTFENVDFQSVEFFKIKFIDCKLKNCTFNFCKFK